MTGYEIVKRAVEFGTPERIPSTSALFCGNDFHYVQLDSPPYVPRKPGYDEWGYTMARTDIPNNGMPDDLPIATWDMLEPYRWPDPRDERRYESLARRLEMPEAGEKYVHVGWFVGLFDMVYRLHSFEDCMVDFLQEPTRMKFIIGKVADFIVGAIDVLAERFPGRIHGLLIPDDWGSQNSTFLSLPMWKEFFGGPYRRIGQHLHQAGIHFWLHSDGRINGLLETLLDCGLDAINMPAPQVVGVDEIGRGFAGRLCFANGVDIQSTLISGSDEQIEAEARDLVAKWNTPRGGFIPHAPGNLKPIGATPDKALVAVNAFRKYAWHLPPLRLEDLAGHL